MFTATQLLLRKRSQDTSCGKNSCFYSIPIYGIRITMFYNDHSPPHFHAEYAGHKALVDIQGGYVIKGALPFRQLKLILAWCELHRDELMQNWELSKDAKPLNHIDPLV